MSFTILDWNFFWVSTLRKYLPTESSPRTIFTRIRQNHVTAAGGKKAQQRQQNWQLLRHAGSSTRDRKNITYIVDEIVVLWCAADEHAQKATAGWRLTVSSEIVQLWLQNLASVSGNCGPDRRKNGCVRCQLLAASSHLLPCVPVVRSLPGFVRDEQELSGA